jgi:dUTP pyrophosphatase
MQLKVKKITKKARLPKKHNNNDAAFDLYAIEDMNIPAGGTDIVHTGISIEIEEGYFGKIESRSSLAKKGVFCTAGVIDSGYRGEVMIVVNNIGSSDHQISIGNRIAQMIIYKLQEVEIIETKELDSQLDRGGGFGSSGE